MIRPDLGAHSRSRRADCAVPGSACPARRGRRCARAGTGRDLELAPGLRGYSTGEHRGGPGEIEEAIREVVLESAISFAISEVDAEDFLVEGVPGADA